MSNPYYEDNGKLFLKCKQCGEYKEINKDNRYPHKLGFLGVSGRCKKCVLEGRKTEHELKMARVRDTQRYKNNIKRRQQIYDSTKRRIKRHLVENKDWCINHVRAGMEIKKMGIRPKICPICGYEGRIVAHHPDINKRNEIVFCCQICHDAIHKKKITIYKIQDLLGDN